MGQEVSLNVQQKLGLNLKQMQRLILSPQMQQALNLLQLPVLELAAQIELELEQNPLLEVIENEENEDIVNAEPEAEEPPQAIEEQEVQFDDEDFAMLRRIEEDFGEYWQESGASPRQRTVEEDKLLAYQESTIRAESTLFDHLMRQAQEAFKNPEELHLAEVLIGNFDAQGYLQTPLTEIAQMEGCSVEQLKMLLQVIQTFEPYGVGAESVQEALLIQLKCRGKSNSLAYKILQNFYQELLHNRIPLICHALGCSTEEVDAVIHREIAKLDLHPGTQYARGAAQPIVPDILIEREGETLNAIVPEEAIPAFRLNHRYLRLLTQEGLSEEAKEFIKQKILSAKWLVRNLFQRKATLEKIADFLIKSQHAFFLDPNGKLVPMTLKMAAIELELHESTIARAVANKYLYCDRGVIPLKNFFTNAFVSNTGEDISSQTVREFLKEIIAGENKRKPLSDEAIATKIQARGIPCARRTIAKYRRVLGIGSTRQRRQY